MLNILIIEKNLNYAVSIMNYLNKSNLNIRIYNITSNFIQAIDILNANNDIDIVLLDMNIIQNNLNKILSELTNKELYKNSFIILNDKTNYTNNLCFDDLIYDILDKNIPFENLIIKLNLLLNTKNETKLEKQIRDEILYLNYDISNKGTIYLIDAIKYIILNMPYKEFNNLKSEVYPKIAQKNHNSVHNIKSNIVRANDKMYKQCEINKLLKYFQFYEDRKPDIRTVIRTIINKIA